MTKNEVIARTGTVLAGAALIAALAVVGSKPAGAGGQYLCQKFDIPAEAYTAWLKVDVGEGQALAMNSAIDEAMGSRAVAEGDCDGYVLVGLSALPDWFAANEAVIDGLRSVIEGQ